MNSPLQRGAVRKGVLTFLVIAAMLAVAGYYAWRTWWRTEDATERYVISTVATNDMEDTVTATGTLQPRDYVDVGAQVSGQLKRLLVEVGSQVREGDLLAEIDAVVQQTRVESGRAGLANLRATLLDRQAQLELAERQFQRQQNLLKGEATTTESVQTAEAQLRSARAQLAALSASIRQSESTLRGDEANLGYTKIYAPISGTVVSVAARQGQTLNANQSAPIILRVADLSVMTVGAQVSEADIAKLRLGMPVYFTTLGSQGRRWYGTLRKTEPTPTITSNVVLYNALFDVPNPQGQLMTQMTAQIFFVVASAKDALTVPLSALRPAPIQALDRAARPMESASGGDGQVGNPERTADASRPGGSRPAPGQRPRFPGGRAVVTVVKDDNATEERAVKVGVTTRVQAQILDGLAPGERVVIGNKQPGAARDTSANRPPPLGGPR
ncbi:MAG: efflux transporter periplasmic adaptor subunit [Rhizobacter sp.]|nr:efflux transporter periplasmic adaptor subunit [Rhizobacter sp.]